MPRFGPSTVDPRRGFDEEIWRNESGEHNVRPASASLWHGGMSPHRAQAETGPQQPLGVSMRSIVSLALAVGAFRNNKGAT